MLSEERREVLTRLAEAYIRLSKEEARRAEVVTRQVAMKWPQEGWQ